MHDSCFAFSTLLPARKSLRLASAVVGERTKSRHPCGAELWRGRPVLATLAP